MSFIYPEFLFALFALAIPIIIHLFNFRRFKKIYFTNVQFLREIKQDTQSRSRLKHLLILISRMLAVIFLVFAFAQPYFPVNKQKITGGSRKIGIYVDNSFSMDALGKNGSLIEVAKKKAREMAMAYKPSDQFQLLSNDFEARHQRLLSREEFLQELDAIQPSAAVRKFTEVTARQAEALHSAGTAPESSPLAYVISDFQKSTSNFQDMKSDSTLRITLVPLSPTEENNLYIDTCFLNTPFVQLNTPQELVVRLKNTGKTSVENVPLKLTVNGSQKSLASISIPANSVSDARLSFTVNEAGWQAAQLTITDYPVSFDDNFYFSFNVRTSVQVLSINGIITEPYVDALFSKDPYFQFHKSSAVQVDYSSFPAQQLIVLNEIDEFSSGLVQELKNYVALGGTLFVIPSQQINFASYRDLLQSLGCPAYETESSNADKVTRVESAHSLFSDVFENRKSLPENMDLPVVNKHYIISRNTKSTEESVLRLQSGATFLGITKSGKGTVYSLAVPLEPEYSNFARHALFVPVFLKAALQGSSEIHAPLVIGHDLDFEYNDSLISGENIFHLKNDELKFDVIPESRMLEKKTILSFHDQVKMAGNYSLNAGSKFLSWISFNYDRTESDLNAYSTAELSELTGKYASAQLNLLEAENKDLTHSLAQLNEGTRLWKICLILALVSLALEVLLIRFHKT